MTAWNSWTFSSKAEWDSPENGFLFNKNTNVLFETAEFIIGDKKPSANIYMVPEINLYEDKKVKFHLGMENLAIITEDDFTEEIMYYKVRDLNKDFLVEPLAVLDGNSNTTINADFDFTYRSYRYSRYGLIDLAKNFGAMKATFFPMFTFCFYPLVALIFVYRMARIIENMYDLECFHAIKVFQERALVILKKI